MAIQPHVTVTRAVDIYVDACVRTRWRLNASRGGAKSVLRGCAIRVKSKQSRTSVSSCDSGLTSAMPVVKFELVM